ncbi:hypothetical protein [Escherichia coli]
MENYPEKQNELYRRIFTKIVSELMPIVNNCLMTSRFLMSMLYIQKLFCENSEKEFLVSVTREMAEHLVAMSNKTKRKKALLVTQISFSISFQSQRVGVYW